MEESKNLLVALEKMLAMKTVGVKPTASLKPTPSTSKKRPHEPDESSPAKKLRLEHSVKKSVGNTFSTVSIPTRDAIDFTEFLNTAKDEICGVISNELDERKALKFHLSVNLELERNSVDVAVTTATPYLHSLPSVVLESSDLEEQYQTAANRLKDLIDVFQGEGSGFTLRSVQECTVNVATYDVVGGSSFIELPMYIKNKMACVNIENTDEFCFLYNLSYVRNPPNSKDANRPNHYKKDLVNFNVDGLKFTLPVKQIAKFENQNEEFSVNVYALDEEKEKSRENQVNLYPVYTSPHRNRKHHANLLLIKSENKSHYALIKSLSRLLAGRTAHSGGSDRFVCKFCLYAFEKEHSLVAHEEMCSQHPAQKVVYPTPDENILKFKNFGNTLGVPFTIFADCESKLLPTSDPKKYNKLQKS